jgi:gliding motility-associated protein GldM
MAGYKETPRQKMIGMMYLVLTALLALNVSKDILNAFVTVNDGLVQTNQNFEDKNQALMMDFAAQMALQPEKVEPFYKKAEEASKLSNEMVQYIKDLMTDVIAYTEFGVAVQPNNAHRSDEKWKQAAEINLASIKKQDNYNKPMVVMQPKPENLANGRARELRDKVWEYRDKMLLLLEESQRDEMNLGFNYYPAENKHYKNQEMEWEFNTFYHTVLAAHVVIFNRMINEVRNAEADIIAKLRSNIDELDFKFDQIDVAVVPTTMMVPQGSQFEAQIFVAAFDTKSAIRAEVNGQPIPGDSGRVFFRQTASGTGTQEVKGELFVFDPSVGGEKAYPFSTSYSVFKPMATVAATNMNVFYRGLENPVSVSVPGYSHGNISVSISAGHQLISKGGGEYIVKPGGGREATINVSARGPDGSSRAMGSTKFRIRAVPTPVAKFAGVQGGNIDKARIVANPLATADMGDFVFEGVRFTVTSFNFVMAERSGVLTTLAQRGNRLDGAALGRVQAATRGQRIFIENIMAKGPDGSTHNLGSVILRVN